MRAQEAKGVLAIDDAFFMPCFFVGVVDKKGFETAGKEGLLSYEHQCDGHGCSQRNIHGLFLPLWSCRDENVRVRFLRMAETFSGYNEPLPIADLKIAFYSAVEAYVPFFDIDQAYSWLLRNGLEYISDIDPHVPLAYQDNVSRNEVEEAVASKSIRTTPLAWKSLDAFADWMRAASGLPLDRCEFTVGWIYVNSD